MNSAPGLHSLLVMPSTTPQMPMPPLWGGQTSSAPQTMVMPSQSHLLGSSWKPSSIGHWSPSNKGCLPTVFWGPDTNHLSLQKLKISSPNKTKHGCQPALCQPDTLFSRTGPLQSLQISWKSNNTLQVFYIRKNLMLIHLSFRFVRKWLPFINTYQPPWTPLLIQFLQLFPSMMPLLWLTPNLDQEYPPHIPIFCIEELV